MLAFLRLIDAIKAEGSAALVTLARVQGSSPREAGARMVVRPSGGFHGTIGGGALEWAALEAAQAALKQGRGPALRRSLALGPELAQCCGGRVEWRIETFDRRDLRDLGVDRGCGRPRTRRDQGGDRAGGADRAKAGRRPAWRGSDGGLAGRGRLGRAAWRKRPRRLPVRRGTCRARARARACAAALRRALDRLAPRSLSRSTLPPMSR